MGIYVWGTGCGASELLEKGLELERIAAFVDSYPSGETFLDKPVLLPEQIPMGDCQGIIVTTRHSGAVAQRCAQLGIPGEKLLFLKNNHLLVDQNRDSQVLELLPGPVRERLFPARYVITQPEQLADSRLPQSDRENDYVRLATLELLCRRVEAVPGAAAELGVYRGFFARSINTLLPDRKLYLFDSFAGFRPEEGAGQAFQAAHENAAADRVLAILPHREQACIKAGFFPESLEGLEERFCLVSLDVDFEQTTLEGLRYFWPRLNEGGYLMLHDWGSPKLPGVARAVARYESELGRKLPAVPLCDLGGSLILCK